MFYYINIRAELYLKQIQGCTCTMKDYLSANIGWITMKFGRNTYKRTDVS